PLTWAILEVRHEAYDCLIVATNGPVDSGHIVLRRRMHLTGYELNAVIHAIQAKTTIAICLDFVNAPEPPQHAPQTVEASVQAQRRPQDSLLDPNASLSEQFNLLRVVDNDRYPAYFYMDGNKYILKIFHDDDQKETGKND